jgi:GT2 family glycosyltransferase
MSADLPGISVVVPTWSRSRHVAELLTSLGAAAKRFAGPSETLVVDDSDPEEAAVIQELCELHGARYFRGTASVRQKRNLGVEQALHPIVLFVDSDCRATPDLFSQHARIHTERDDSVAGVAGVTEFIGRESWMWEVIQRTQFLNAFSFARRMEHAPWATCSNTSFRRDVLRDLGGFDTGFPFRLGGDDLDLGLRVQAAGYRIRCNPEAEVHHARDTWESFPAVYRRALRWGRMDVHVFFRKHRDRVGFGMPKLSQIFLLFMLAALAQAGLIASMRPLVWPFLWGALTLLLQAGMTVFARRAPLRSFPQELAADLLGLAFELGTLFEGIQRRELSVLSKTVRRGPVLPGFEQQEWILQAWSMWIAGALILLLSGL